MTNNEAYQVYRLKQSAKRLEKFYRLNAPDIVKKVELAIIREVYDELQLILSLE